MKKLRLWVHSKDDSKEDEVVFNPKEFPDVAVGDLLEIFHPEDDKDAIPGQPRLLLQVIGEGRVNCVRNAVVLMLDLADPRMQGMI